MKKTFDQNPATIDYMVDEITHVCHAYKSRTPGSPSEREAQDYFATELHQWADEVEVEEFDVHPHAFMGWLPIVGVFMITSVILFFFSSKNAAFPYISLALSLLSAIMFFGEFIFYRKTIDFLFPKRISKNVMATRNPTGEVKRRIIFGGHTDAAYEWTFSYYGQIKTLAPVIGGAILSLFAALISFIVYVISGRPEMVGAWRVVSVVLLCTIPFFIAVLFFTNWKRPVDGANDNLTANLVSMAVLKEMSERGIRFENTEVCCLLTGSEEAGLRGAKAYAKRHNKKLKEIETIFVALETLREVEQLAAYTRGQTGTVHNSEAGAELLIEAGQNVGIELPRAGIYPGAVDAEAFTQAGITAIGLGGVNHDPKRYYHTREDTADNISPECLKISLDIALETAYLYDENGIAPYEEKASKK